MNKIIKKIWEKIEEKNFKELIQQGRRFAHKKKISKKVTSAKRRRQRYTYNPDPKTTLIVQFFNSKLNIGALIGALRQPSIEEIIIIDDGSVDGSGKKWIKELDRPNEFLLRSHDIYEVRTYDRALQMANGEFVCFTQDDDIPPENDNWVTDALHLFEKDPDLLILGGLAGLHIRERNASSGPLQIPGIDSSVRYDTHGYDITESPAFCHPEIGCSFQYVMAVNRPPMWVRRDEFIRQGGIDQTFAPFQCDDVDACLRAWENGSHVGLYSPNFQRDYDAGGMHHFNDDRVSKQARSNWAEIYTRYGSNIRDSFFTNAVIKANEKLSK